MELVRSEVTLLVVVAGIFVVSFTDGRYLLVEVNDEKEIDTSGIMKQF